MEWIHQAPPSSKILVEMDGELGSGNELSKKDINEVERQLVSYDSVWLCACFSASPRTSLYS